MAFNWYHFTVGRVGEHPDGEPFADVCCLLDNDGPELDNKYTRQLSDILYDIPNAHVLWEGWVFAHDVENAETIVENDFLNREQKSDVQFVACSLEDDLVVHIGEHKPLVSFGDDANNVAFQEWWHSTGHKEFSKYWEENKEQYKD